MDQLRQARPRSVDVRCAAQPRPRSGDVLRARVPAGDFRTAGDPAARPTRSSTIASRRREADRRPAGEQDRDAGAGCRPARGRDLESATASERQGSLRAGVPRAQHQRDVADHPGLAGTPEPAPGAGRHLRCWRWAITATPSRAASATSTATTPTASLSTAGRSGGATSTWERQSFRASNSTARCYVEAALLRSGRSCTRRTRTTGR